MPEDDAPIQRTIHDEDDNDLEDHEESDDALVRRVQGPTPPQGGVVIDDSGGGDDHGGDDVQGINVWTTDPAEAVQGPTPALGGVVIDDNGGDDSDDTRDFDVDNKTTYHRMLVESFAGAEEGERSVQPGSYTLQWVQGLQQPATGDELLELVIHDALINEGVDLHENIDDMSVLLVFMAKPGLAAMVAATNAHYTEDDEQPFERQRNEVTIKILQTVAEGGEQEIWRLDPTREQRSALNIAATRLATYMARPLTARARMTRVERLRYLAALGQPPPTHLLKHLKRSATVPPNRRGGGLWCGNMGIGCPCTSRWPGFLFCCVTCARGQVCRRNCHPTPGGGQPAPPLPSLHNGTPRQEAKCVTDASSSRPPTKQGVSEGSAREKPATEKPPKKPAKQQRAENEKQAKAALATNQLTSEEDLTVEVNEVDVGIVEEDYRMRKNGLPQRSEEEAAKWKAICEGGVDHAKTMAKYTEVDITTFHAQMQERASKRRAIEDDNTINDILPAATGRMVQQRCEDVLNVGSNYGRDYILQAQVEWDVAWTKGMQHAPSNVEDGQGRNQARTKQTKRDCLCPPRRQQMVEESERVRKVQVAKREATKREAKERPLDQLPKRAKSQRAKVKIPTAQYSTKTPCKAATTHTVKGRLDSTKLKEETLASLDEYWEAVDDGNITVDDLHEAEENIGVLVEKFRHGPNRYISQNFLL